VQFTSRLEALIKEPIDTEDDKHLSEEKTVSVIKRTLMLKRLLGRMDWQVR